MKKVGQKIVDKGKGDCMRACFASIMNLEIDCIPHFRLFPDDNWHLPMNGFLDGCGYEWHGTGYVKSHLPMSDYPNLGGLVLACVPSKTYVDEDITHMVIINLNGLVVHDPHPDKKYQDINVLETNELEWWLLIDSKRP